MQVICKLQKKKRKKIRQAAKEKELNYEREREIVHNDNFLFVFEGNLNKG